MCSGKGNKMNLRIKELLEQAGVKYVNMPKDTVYEKFAELIVRECLDIASEVRGEPKTDTHFVIGYNRACEKMIDAIKEHFGVEQ
jgi:hypothetical protein